VRVVQQYIVQIIQVFDQNVESSFLAATGERGCDSALQDGREDIPRCMLRNKRDIIADVRVVEEPGQAADGTPVRNLLNSEADVDDAVVPRNQTPVDRSNSPC
jgi:hypothetical protein